jgi:hypothetical protein
MDMRKTMLHNAVNAVRAEAGSLDVATVAKHLPADFDLRDDEEFAAAIGATNPASEAYDAAQAAAPAVADEPAEVMPALDEPTQAHELPTLQEAEQHVIDLRVMLRQLSDDLRVKRGKLADAITRWQTDGSPMTQGELVRDFLKSEQAERARKAKQGYGEQASAPTPGRSHLDRIASGSRGGTPDRGYSSSFRRGGRPVSQYGTRVKLPSQA